MFNKFKKKIVHSFLHKPLSEVRFIIDKVRVSLASDKFKKRIYIVSPYKTGTTYVDSLWNNQVSLHEPLHLYSLKCLESNFNKKLNKRANLLDLKMECSGFLSLYLDKLPPGNDYFFIIRPPHKWVQSVMNHFIKINKLNYNFIEKYYWSKFLGYDMSKVIRNKEPKQIKNLVYNLFKIYFIILESAIKNEEINFVMMDNIDDLILVLNKKIGIDANYKKSWKRKSEIKFTDVNVNKIGVDFETKYQKLIASIPQNRWVNYTNDV